MQTKSRKVIPVANAEFRVKLVLAAVILTFLLQYFLEIGDVTNRSLRGFVHS
jgi:hypothetical protein